MIYHKDITCYESPFYGLFEQNLLSQHNVRDSFRLKLYLIQNEVLHPTPPSTIPQCASMSQKKFSTSTIWHIRLQLKAKKES